MDAVVDSWVAGFGCEATSLRVVFFDFAAGFFGFGAAVFFCEPAGFCEPLGLEVAFAAAGFFFTEAAATAGAVGFRLVRLAGPAFPTFPVPVFSISESSPDSFRFRVGVLLPLFLETLNMLDIFPEELGNGLSPWTLLIFSKSGRRRRGGRLSNSSSWNEARRGDKSKAWEDRGGTSFGNCSGA